MLGRLTKVAGFALVVCLATALPVAAQLTTGSVAGTVKDAQAAVIPGATITLISETKGTKSPPIVTNEIGDFLFVNVPPDMYTIEVTMPAFKTLKRSGLSVNPGNRTGLGTLTIEVGGTSEVIDVKGETPVIQATSGERSFTISTEAVENLPTASRSFIALALLAPGVSGTVANAVRTGGGGDTNIMMDGVSVMDTGSNRPLLQMNVESIQEVKVLTSNYQAEYGRSSGLQITAVTKSGSNRFRGSLYDVERNSDWNSNSQDEQAERRSESRFEGTRLGLLDQRPGRQAGRQQQTLLLLQPGVRTADRRQQRPELPGAHRARAAGRFLADHGQPRQRVQLHQGPADQRAPATRPTRPRASPTAAFAERFPPTCSIRPA